MVFARGKDKLMKKLCDAIDANVSSISGHTFSIEKLLSLSPSDEIFKNICKMISDTRYRYPSDIYRLVLRNKQCLQDILSKDKKDVACIDSMNEELSKLKVNEFSPKSYRCKDSMYGNLCKRLGKKIL